MAIQAIILITAAIHIITAPRSHSVSDMAADIMAGITGAIMVAITAGIMGDITVVGITAVVDIVAVAGTPAVVVTTKRTA